ncbi:TAF5-like RNA polymerase II p300/CBP-associated factor-associated factor 65 kDa subunit 5L [Drosophila miranda]|uniref:TAF5-like RNA polymerase II p300/CBP-associated factor-associated factor 65 kDa subunit 5L n=1 Tax=Drosophila miranda TaxID=7229 RepID=UPI0007E7517C|nr:TAF5-like RNA polymerase II p300/CBP-associated factor-associated factor 65 kDa subunit 5L [Drosophila miranda]
MNYSEKNVPSNKKRGEKEKPTVAINLENGDQLSANSSSEYSHVFNNIQAAIELLKKTDAIKEESSNGVSGNCAARSSKLPTEPVEPIAPNKRIEMYKHFKDFYEGDAIEGESFHFGAIVDEEIFLEYEQAFRGTKKIVDTVASNHKFEIFLMLYPMLTIGYLKMVLGEKLERATSFLEEGATYLDKSYSQRIEKLKLIRTPEDLPERALELLASADTVEIIMAYPTYYLYITCVAKWTRGQQEKLLGHFAIRSYTDEDPLEEWTFPGLPQLEPLVDSSVDLPHYRPLDRDARPTIFTYAPVESDAEILCFTPSEDLSMVALGLSNHFIRVAVGVDKIGLDKLDSILRKGKIMLGGHKGPVMSLAFSPKDRFLLSCSLDSTMRLWCVASWTCASVYPNQLCTFVIFAPQGFIFAGTSDDGIARVWGRNTKKPALELAGHLADMAVCLFHSNSRHLATGSADCTVRVWDIFKGVQVRLFRGHKNTITALAYSKCGRYLISGGHDFLIIVSDTFSGRMVRTLKYHTSVIRSIAVDMENNALAVGSDIELSFWDFQLLVNHFSADLDPDDKESSPKPSTKELLYSSSEHMKTSLRCLRFVGRNHIMAVCTGPTGEEEAGKKKAEDGVIVTKDIDKAEGSVPIKNTASSNSK